MKACFALLVLLVPAMTYADDRWVVYDGFDGPGKGKHVVLIAGDHEYRSEETIPQLAKILAKHHGFKCTVLFTQDPKDSTINPNIDNIPGLEALKSAHEARLEASQARLELSLARAHLLALTENRP